MNIIPVALGLAAGVGLYAAVVHMIVGLSRRPRDLTHVTFALASLSVTGVLLAILAIHTAESVTQYIWVFKFGFGLSVLFFTISILWFVAVYTGVVPHRFLLAMGVWFVAIVILHLILPFGILFAEIGGLRNITLPGGEPVVIHQQAPPHPWRPAVDLFLLIMFGFFFYAIYRQFQAGRRQRALLLCLAVLILFLADRFDTLVDLGVISSIYIGTGQRLGDWGQCRRLVPGQCGRRNFGRQSRLQRHQLDGRYFGRYRGGAYLYFPGSG